MNIPTAKLSRWAVKFSPFLNFEYEESQRQSGLERLVTKLIPAPSGGGKQTVQTSARMRCSTLHISSETAC
ncbi:hypothetical protein [Deinococcus sp.]|uniref:hypothetical protein n=1 Tax=Deinococcus sp. TaxID=47478 RepID=UPI0025E4C2F6|nr:hypothetical protein [Deinococcus sp.]